MRADGTFTAASVLAGLVVYDEARYVAHAHRLLMAAVTLSIFAEGMWAVVMAFQVIALDDDPRSLSLVATCLGTQSQRSKGVQR